jgi:hypothetical protein
MKLKEMALLLYFYLVFKDKTELKVADLVMLKKMGDGNLSKFLEDYDKVRESMSGMDTKQFVPYVVLRKRDEVGLFRGIPEKQIIDLCGMADMIIEEEKLVDYSHLVDTELKPYVRTVERLMLDIYSKKNMLWYGKYNLRNAFENVSESDLEKFLLELHHKMLTLPDKS